MFRLTKNTGRHLLPKVCINPNDFLPEPSYNGKRKSNIWLLNPCIYLGVVSSCIQVLGFHLQRL